MATTETVTRTGQARRGGPKRIRVVLRRVGPWSVLKLSLIFYFCLMLVALLGLGILYWVLGSVGVLDTVAGFLESITLVEPGFRFNGTAIFRTLFLIGLATVAVWSLLTVFVVFLYNLISDLVGGVEVTLTERR